jgi:hypothetical protein
MLLLDKAYIALFRGYYAFRPSGRLSVPDCVVKVRFGDWWRGHAEVWRV